MSGYTIFVFSALALASSGFVIKVPTNNQQPKTGQAQTGWLRMQKMIIPFFENVCEQSTDPDIITAAQEFDVTIVKNSNFINSGSSIQFTNGEVITNLQKLLAGKGLIPKGEIFTEYNEEHLNELKIIFEVLCFARNFDSFYKAAAWARQNVNCGLFIDVIYLSIINRRETNLLSIPAPYEVLPNYFIRKDIIAKASSLMYAEEPFISEGIRNEGNAYIIDANYTADYYNNADESVLAYFHEDIGLNSYYFLRKLKSAPWFISPMDPDNNYGEMLYFTIKQLAARYDLERYSNGLPELIEMNWDNLKLTPYDSMLIYSNGEDFASRLYDSYLTENDITDVSLLKDIEENISTYITHVMKYVQSRTGYNRRQVMNHLMEILMTNDKSYNSLAMKIMKTYINNGKISSMEHYMTSLRDPIFWLLNKKIVSLVEKSLDVLPKYTKKELYFPGIEIVNIEAKKIMTMCDNFEFDVTDALKTNTTKTSFQVKIGQQRLSHKPFTIKINVDSRIKQKGYVKIFLGPKTLPGELFRKKTSFMLLDCFETVFKLGMNVISRSSDSMSNVSNDFESLKAIRKKVLDAEFGLYTSPSNSIDKQTNFPSRLIIPKGSPEGLPFQLFVFITPYTSTSVNMLDSTYNVDFMSEIISTPTYPLDLGMDDSSILELPNAMVKDIIITHKGENKAASFGNGADSKWNTDFTYETPQNKPSYGKREPFDYKSKRSDYETNEEFSFKNDDNVYKNIQSGKHMLEINNLQNELDKRESFEKREPFDYKAKKAENEKKREGYKNKGNFTKNDSSFEEKTNENMNGLNVITNSQKEQKNVLPKINSGLLNSPFGNQETYGKHEPFSKREPFDYKAKKEENEKKRKAYQNRDNFTKKDSQGETITDNMKSFDINKSEDTENSTVRVIPLLKSSQKMYELLLRRLFSGNEKMLTK